MSDPQRVDRHWLQKVVRLGYRAEVYFDALKRRLHQSFGRPRPVAILAYRGYGTSTDFFLRGRVLEDKGIARATDADSVWKNLLHMYHRFESDELPGVRVRASFQAAAQEVVTDEEGFFTLRLQPTAPLPADQDWHSVELQLVEADTHEHVRAAGHILVPDPSCAFGVISDIDDTILETHSNNLWLMAKLTVLHNARTRLPLEGVAHFYRALQAGPHGTSRNPIFYVSSSPWNLYDLLVDFMNVHGIPGGPLFLRDFGLGPQTQLRAGHTAHKQAHISHLLQTYPGLPFLLIGDTGQQDAEIYAQIVKDFPGRIRAIYIRQAGPCVNSSQLDTIATAVTAQGVELCVVQDSATAVSHARRQGLIASETI